MAQDRGAIVAEGARCGWALDGGALHLYGFEGDVAGAPALVAGALRIGSACSAAVCVAELDSEDRWVAALLANGFETDDAEPTVAGGRVRTELTLLCVLHG